MKPQLIRPGLILATIFSATLIFSSCHKNDNEEGPAGTSTITDVVIHNDNFSLLETALIRAGLDDELKGTGPFTVFAPDNAAFAASGINEAAINSMDSATLARFLLYHVVATDIPASAIPESDTLNSMLDSINLYASRNPNGAFINGETITTTDVHASNGTIHVIKKALVAPTKTIAQVVYADPQFSLLYASLMKSGFIVRVTDPSKYTIFAPTNAAFEAAGWNQAAIDAATEQEVTDLLKHHVTITNTFTSDLVDNTLLYSFMAGTTLTVGKTPPGLKLTGSAAGNSKIITTTAGKTYNVVTTNGVFHEIDKVIL